ncbi:MAG: hypothetical protein PHU63_04265 [Candidatus ainarchaeum sp.]|nr:hypothetical protein [Candidatus ainarchaeum sp.]
MESKKLILIIIISLILLSIFAFFLFENIRNNNEEEIKNEETFQKNASTEEIKIKIENAIYKKFSIS